MKRYYKSAAFDPERQTSQEFFAGAFDFLTTELDVTTPASHKMHTVLTEAAINTTRHSAQGRNGSFVRLHGTDHPITTEIVLTDSFCRLSLSNFSSADRSVTLNGRPALIQNNPEKCRGKLGLAWYTYSEGDHDAHNSRGNGLVDIVEDSDELSIQSQMVKRDLFRNTVTATVFLDDNLSLAA